MDMHKALQEVMTATEAAERWALNHSTVKYACSGQKGLPPRFTPDECRKSGKMWLVTRAGMVRLYGEEREGQ